MTINWYGASSQGEGYSGASENIIVALERLGVDVRLISPKHPTKTLFNGMTKEGIAIAKKPFKLADIGILMGFPNAFSSVINKYKIGFTMFETDKLPNGLGYRSGNNWAGITGNATDRINEMDELWLPSEHNINLFRQEGVTIPIHKIHLGVDTNMYFDMSEKRASTRKDRPFTFLMLGKLTSRKNVGAAIYAFNNLFAGNKDVQLIIKSHSGTIAAMRFPDDINIKIIDELCPVEKIQEYYQNADAFVFPSRGEGFGLPPLEAMATGLPAIFSDNTGMSEFANREYNFPVSCNEKSRAANFPRDWGDVGNWEEVDLTELQAKMLYVYENEAEAIKIGRKAAKWVCDTFTYENTAKTILKHLLEAQEKLEKSSL